MPVVMWFRRDLRRRDHPALARAVAAAESAGTSLLPLFVLIPGAWQRLGAPARTYLSGSLAALAADLGSLHVRSGSPEQVLADLAEELGPLEVHVTGASTPAGMARDRRAASALDACGSQLIATGTDYAVAPGSVRKADGSAYRVFSPFHRAWLAAGWPAPAPTPDRVPILELPGDPLPDPAAALSGGSAAQEPAAGGSVATGFDLPEAGEAAALRRWEVFRTEQLAEYARLRDRPDLPATSRLSIALRWGGLHPRTLLAALDAERDARFAAELCWREFSADVLFHNPTSRTQSLDPAYDRIATDSGPEADELFEAWALGRTGYPFVDAGMRQLRAEGWMHNRARMVAASFLVKDLHLPWWRGEREFMRWLADGDPASNALNWQWVAGSGPDAAPYVRVFNPVLQGQRFDPDGAYVRRYVPELAHLAGAAVHEPWTVLDGHLHGYPEPIVDHAEERAEALRRHAAAR